MTATKHGMVRIPGTSLAPPRGARREPLGRSAAQLTITLHLHSRARHTGALEEALEAIIAGHRAPLTHEEFAAEFGTSKSAIQAVRRFARARGFRVAGVSIAKRTVRLTGQASSLAQAFGVNQVRFRRGDTAWDSFTGYIYLPAELTEFVDGVLGFDETPDLHVRHRGTDLAATAPKPKVSYTAPEVAALYGFPPRPRWARTGGRGHRAGRRIPDQRPAPLLSLAAPAPAAHPTPVGRWRPQLPPGEHGAIRWRGHRRHRDRGGDRTARSHDGVLRPQFAARLLRGGGGGGPRRPPPQYRDLHQLGPDRGPLAPQPAARVQSPAPGGGGAGNHRVLFLG